MKLKGGDTIRADGAADFPGYFAGASLKPRMRGDEPKGM